MNVLLTLPMLLLATFSTSFACNPRENKHTLECTILLHNTHDAQHLILNDEFDYYNHNFETPLHLCAQVGEKKLMPLLLQKISIDRIDIHSNTALHYALLFTETACAQLLIEHDADCNIKNNLLKEPLHVAASSDMNRHILNRLTTKKVAINHSDLYGNAPLHITTKHGAYHNALHLLDYHGDASLKNKHNQTPLMLLYQSKKWHDQIQNQRKLALLLLANLLCTQKMPLHTYLALLDNNHKSASDYARDNEYIFYLPDNESMLKQELLRWFSNSEKKPYEYLWHRAITGKPN